MLAKRLIPCLDVANGRVVKGVNFLDIKDAGDPVEIAKKYYEQGADELAFLDISASHEGRKTLIETIERVAKCSFIPLTVGGGIRSIDDIKRVLHAGADKVSINSAAITEPNLVYDASHYFGSQCIVVAIDAKRVSLPHEPLKWEIFTHGGRNRTGIDAVQWAKNMAEQGAGELLVTSMDQDGTKAGFDLPLMQQINGLVGIPTIASGGVGSLEHLRDGILIGRADAVLAASIFHYGIHTIAQAKQFLSDAGICIRPINSL